MAFLALSMDVFSLKAPFSKVRPFRSCAPGRPNFEEFRPKVGPTQISIKKIAKLRQGPNRSPGPFGNEAQSIMDAWPGDAARGYGRVCTAAPKGTKPSRSQIVGHFPCVDTRRPPAQRTGTPHAKSRPQLWPPRREPAQRRRAGRLAKSFTRLAPPHTHTSGALTHTPSDCPARRAHVGRAHAQDAPAGGPRLE